MKTLFLVFILLSSVSLRASENVHTDAKEAFDVINQALDFQKKKTANERAEFYYESVVEDKACNHCPEYLSLIKEVNKIVEKIPTPDDVKASNQQLLQMDRLKFMYYETVASINGNEVCSIFESKEPTKLKGIERDKLTMLAEELISLPNVSSFQFYPQPPFKEVRYLYRGEGLQSHILIEVIVREDRSAVIRYHHYDPYDLPDIGGEVQKERKFNELDLNSTYGRVNIDTSTTLNINEQSSRASLGGNTRDWVQIEARHSKDNEASLKTILPMEVSIPSDSSIKIKGNISHEQKENLANDEHDKIDRAELNISSDKLSDLFKARLEKKEGKQEFGMGSKHEFKLDPSLKIQGELEQIEVRREDEKSLQQKVNLTLGNEKGTHEYVKAKIDKHNDIETIHLSTKHVWDVNSQTGLKVKTEAAQITTERDKDKVKKNEIFLSLTDHGHEYVTARVVQGDDLDRLISLSSRYGLGNYGSVNVSVDRYDSGKENVSFGHSMTSGKNSYQTNVGHSSEAGQFINFKAERKISEMASMILTIQTDSNDNRTVMYQYEAKF